MLNNPELLVVDDTPESLRVLIGMLQQRGYRIRSANGGRRALASALKSPPDLILLDICMPDMNGYEVCRLLKEDESTRDIPVLFMSSLDDTEDKLRAFQEGGVDYITKPYQEAEVVARIQTQLLILGQRRKIQEDYLRLRRLEELREGLTHMLVHDLRTPLTGIIGYSRLLQRMASARLNPEEHQWLGQINELSGSLVEMVSAILDVSRLEADELPLHLELCGVRGLAEEAIESLGRIENCEVLLDVPELLALRCDRELMRRVLVNLISNAVRFSPGGSPVKLQAHRHGEWLEMRICDQGPGIAPEHHQRIFDKFAQVERRGRNSGLGLAFCKMVVEKHCGFIGVESQLGEGSQFWIRLNYEGNLAPEGAALAAGAVEADSPPVGLDDPAADPKPQPAPLK